MKIFAKTKFHKNLPIFAKDFAFYENVIMHFCGNITLPTVPTYLQLFSET